MKFELELFHGSPFVAWRVKDHKPTLYAEIFYIRFDEFLNKIIGLNSLSVENIKKIFT
jgi:hypothetical protein